MAMTIDEQIERTRQAIMRLRELMDIMKVELEQGEAQYEQLFAEVTAEQKATLREKELQLQAAYHHFEDTDSIEKLALHLAFTARNLERDFRQIHDNLVGE